MKAIFQEYGKKVTKPLKRLNTIKPVDVASLEGVKCRVTEEIK